MQIVLLFFSIACLLEFSSEAQQKPAFRQQRSVSHPHIDIKTLPRLSINTDKLSPSPSSIDTPITHEQLMLAEQNDFGLTSLQTQHAQKIDILKDELHALLENYRGFTELEQSLTTFETKMERQPAPVVEEDRPSNPAPLITRRTLSAAGLSILTAGLTAKYLHNKQVKFEPFTIIAGLGIAKSALGGAALLAGVWLLIDKISNSVHYGCHEREKNIKLLAQQREEKMDRDYKETAKELKEQFEKVKKHMEEKASLSHEILIKKFDEYKNSMEKLFKEQKSHIEGQLKEAMQKANESEDTVRELKTIKEQLEHATKSIHDDLSHAVERLKKALRIIEGVARKLPDADRREAEAAICEAEASFEHAMTQAQTVQTTAATIHSPQSFFGKIFHRKTSSRGGTHSRSGSMTFQPHQFAPLTLNSAGNNGTPPNTAQQTVSPHHTSSPGTPASASSLRTIHAAQHSPLQQSPQG